MARIVAVQGEEKTAKSTFGLSAPKPLFYAEFDIGGYDRAIPRFRKDEKAGLIIKQSYPQPLQALININPTTKAKTATEANRVVGIKEIWFKFLTDYIKYLEDPKIKSIIIDTATVCWAICTGSYLQEKQEVQITKAMVNGKLPADFKLRERLSQIEYGEPNDRFRALMNAARNYGKNLCLIHYERDEYKDMVVKDEIKSVATGRVELDGFRHTPKLADIIIKMEIANKTDTTVKPPRKYITPQATIISRVPMESFGVVLPQPSWDSMNDMLDVLQGGE